jgi:hypothetical protein
MIERFENHYCRECDRPETNITLEYKYHEKTLLILVIKQFIQDSHAFIFPYNSRLVPFRISFP